jgi:isopentenyl-diphosphate Delta-isomerase
MAPLTDDQTEAFQVVDAEDREIAVRTRAECHADRTLIHRSVFVCVETPAGMVFQRRGLGKDSHPGWWCMACAGHVSAGESYREAARRELAEEAGIEDAQLEHLGTFLMELPDETEMACVFRARYDGPLVVRPPEVIGLVAFPPGELPEPLTPSARLVLEFLRAG